MSEANSRKTIVKRVVWGIVAAVVLFGGWWIYNAFKVVNALGILDKTQMRQYQGDTMDNLKATWTAISLYQDSEGGFPMADSWMDSIQPYLKTADLTPEEAEKKLKNPLVTKDNPTGFGYAYNESLQGKYWIPDGEPKKDDPECVQDPAKTPLVFDSSDLTKNAHGSPDVLAPNPERPGGNQTVTVSGTVEALDTLLGR